MPEKPPKVEKAVPLGHLRIAQYPGQIDFTEMPKHGAKTNLLVLVDIFTARRETIPTATQKAREVVHALVEVTIPRFGVPKGLESDNDRQFTSEVTQEVSKFLEISCTYIPATGHRHQLKLNA